MRTTYCGLVSEALLGQTVTLMGWAHRRRDHGGVIFVDLRDREGIVQVVCDPDRPEMFAAAVLLHRDYSAKGGPRETDNVAGIPTVDLPSRLIAKLDQVVTDLAAKDISANRAYVVRAVLRAAPKPEAWVAAVKKFLADFPRRPRMVGNRAKTK